MGIWKEWKKAMCFSGRKDNRGLTFVELICAIAIFSVIGTAVGGIMVVSANSYQRGTNEVELQQEAQLTANQIADILIDATSDVGYSDAGMQKTMDIRRGENLYQVTYNAADSRLLYSEYIDNGDGTTTAVALNQLLAEDVTGFEANVDDFANSGNARLFLSFTKNGKTYESWYTITARNGLVESNVEATASIVTIPEITLEPNQEYLLLAEVVGTVSDKTVTWQGPVGNNSANTVVYTLGGSTYLKIGADESAPELTLTVATNAKKENTTEAMAWQTVTVKIRRVDSLDVNGWLVSGEALKRNAVYKIYAAAAGVNLDRVLGVDYDSVTNYKNPYYAGFTYELTVGGAAENAADYIEVVALQEDVSTPCITIRLKQDMPPLSKLVVTASAKHPQGAIGGTAYNKTAVAYGEAKGGYTIENAQEGPHEILDGSGLNRGTGTHIGFPGMEQLKQQYSGGNGQNRNSWRYRLKDGTWSAWMVLSDQGSDFYIRENEIARLDPDKEYELEIMTEIVYNGTVVWPLADTPASEYRTIFPVSRTYVSFKEHSTVNGFTENCTSAGTEGNPVIVHRSQGSYSFPYSNIVAANDNYINQHLQMKVQKLVEGVWKDDSLDGRPTGYDMYINIQNRTEGLYRAELVWDNAEYHYNDGTTDIGIFYFKVVP